MTNALVLGGGAPNLTLMAGAIAALDEAGVKFNVVSTTGAGMLIGLLYAAPKGMTPSAALANTIKMGVDDAIYKVFPVNFKVFHKPGEMAQAYTRFWQDAAGKRGEMAKLSRQWMDASVQSFFPGAAMAPFRDMWKQSLDAFPAQLDANEDAKRFFEDLNGLMLAALCPSDLSMDSKGMCQPAPFVEAAVDFQRLKDFDGEFYMSAYCIETGEMEIFHKDEINLEHFQAALAFPLIYAPFKLGGKTYLEGAAKDTLNFEGLYEYRKDKRHPPIDTIVVCDILGMDKLIGEPRTLYDAWVKSIIVPLVAIAKDDLKLFRLLHKPKIPARYGHAEPKLLTIDFARHMPADHWPNVLDWSYSNLKTLYDVGYQAGKDFHREHGADLAANPAKPARVPRPSPPSRKAAAPSRKAPRSRK